MREVRRCSLNAFAARALERVPLSLRIDSVQFQFDARNRFRMRADEFQKSSHVILFKLFVFLGMLCAHRVRVLGLGEAGGDAAAVIALVGEQEFRNVEDVIRGEQLVNVRGSEVEGIVTLEPRAQLGRNRQAVDKGVARWGWILLFGFLDDLGVAPGEKVKSELPYWLGPGGGGGDPRGKFQGAGGGLRRRDADKQESPQQKIAVVKGCLSHSEIVADCAEAV